MIYHFIALFENGHTAADQVYFCELSYKISANLAARDARAAKIFFEKKLQVSSFYFRPPKWANCFWPGPKKDKRFLVSLNV